MGLLRASARTRGQGPADAAVYRRKFVITVCEVVARGFAQLDAASLAMKQETAVTGLLVDQMRKLVQSRRDCPVGAGHFSIHDDRPEGSGGQEGKNRPRIDIVVESAIPGPRPTFYFEAKRLYSSSSVAEYLGDEGLGCFLSEKYAKDAPDAGMLGYVQDGRPDEWAERISVKLDQERSKHGLTPRGSIWTSETLVPALTNSYRTSHKRGGKRFAVFHVLLACA